MDPYDRLKSEIPNIAKAVNEFKSEQVQAQAFRAMIKALGIAPAEAPDEDDGDAAEEAADDSGTSTTRRTTRRRRRPAAKDNGDTTKGTTRLKAAAPTLDKTLNLRPKGKKAFKDFASEKSPENANERNLVAVYYLEKEVAVGKVNVNQVYTAYKEAGWRLPSYPRNSLQVTASTKGWINTSDMDDITVTPSGENHVDHDLPAKKAKA
ncbi:MAG: hypothetical protein HY263_01085 [Chloroflexi bacterium]|nr:hypothetical protein [Chloroflexota bacterium]